MTRVFLLLIYIMWILRIILYISISIIGSYRRFSIFTAYWNNRLFIHNFLQLDENVRTESLEKCVTYFNTMHTLLLLSSGDTCLHQTKLLLDHTIAFSTACESIRTDVAIMQALIQSDDTSDMSPLCQHLATVAEVMQQHLKQIRRRISASPDVVTLPIPELATNLLKTGICVNKLTKALRDIAKTAFSQIALTTGKVDHQLFYNCGLAWEWWKFKFFPDEIYLSSEKLIEICTSACEKIFDEMPASSAIACIKNSMNYFANEVANVAQAIQEAESYLPSAAANKPEKVNSYDFSCRFFGTIQGTCPTWRVCFS